MGNTSTSLLTQEKKIHICEAWTIYSYLFAFQHKETTVFLRRYADSLHSRKKQQQRTSQDMMTSIEKTNEYANAAFDRPDKGVKYANTHGK